MTTVNTVLGPVPGDSLGMTLMHEHFCTGFAGWQCDALALPYDRKEVAAVCAPLLEEAKGFGLRTVVDATPNDLGRDVELQKEIAERSGVNIIAATGLYREEMGAAAYLKFRRFIYDIESEIYDTFMKEITQGVADTGVKAGVIKVATGEGCISPYEEPILKAAARVQKETGVPIITHTENGTMGVEQADLLIAEGADPEKIVIGHIGGSSDMAYHTGVLGKGVNIAFDRFGIEVDGTDALRKACLIGLLGVGYADRIVLSHDYVPYWLGRTNALPDMAREIMPNWSYAHVFKNIIPDLKRAGISDDSIDAMMVRNPRRLLASG
jgi:phosphotriesterase-related protein